MLDAVGTRSVGPGSPALVIAEIGNNHDGSVHQAERLIDAAAEAGAGAVKFQTHIAEAEMHPSTPTPPHFDEPRWEFTKRMELSADEHRRLKAHAEERGLLFFSSPFSVEAVDLLEEIGVPLYKIASGEVTNPPLLEAIAATGKPVLLSTGMAGLEDVERAMEIAARGGGDVLVLQCTSAYPVPAGAGQPARDARDGRALRTSRSGCPTTRRTSTPRSRPSRSAPRRSRSTSRSRSGCTGPTTTRRSTPEELARLVDGRPPGRGRARHRARSSATRRSTRPARRSRRASSRRGRDPRRHACSTAEMLTTKRPGNGIPALRLGEVVGRRAARDDRRERARRGGDLG